MGFVLSDVFFYRSASGHESMTALSPHDGYDLSTAPREKMDKCFYYLSKGLWNIAEKYFDPESKIQNDYFWSIAVHPNHHSNLATHILSTPWHLSWMAINLLETFQKDSNDSENGSPKRSLLSTLKKEVDFQFTLRNYASDPFVQQLFSIFSKIQNHQIVNACDIDTKAFTSNLKEFLIVLLDHCPSTAHHLFREMLQYSFFASCCEILLHEIDGNEPLCNLIVSSLCQTENISFYLPQVAGLLQTPFRKNLCLILLATDNISCLHAMIEEDRKLFKRNSRARLQSLLDNGIEPLSCFKEMTTMERHFFLLILDLINTHLDELPVMASSPKIPSFIWPIILLQNWNNPLLPESRLCQLIAKTKESTKDKILIQITYVLEWYIKFSNWYEKQEISEGKECIELSKQNLLMKAKDHSVLYLINYTTDLSLTDWGQIKDLLQQGKPHDGDLKTWDLIVFDGYCIMMLVIETIVKSSEIEDLAKMQKVKLEDIAVLNDAFSAIYNDEVTEILKKVKLLLQNLYPLAFRLEILENIFALIFLTYDDVRRMNCFLKCTVNLNKYLEKAQLRNKSSSGGDKSNSLKLGRTQTNSGTPLQIFKRSEEDETVRKQKLRGFICKKYIVRDLIYLVKECLEKVEEDPSAKSEADKAKVPCSIKPGQMENRLDRLLESVSEATWRLQLVTDPDFISEIGTMKYVCGQDFKHHFDPEWIYQSQDQDRSGLPKTRKKTSEKHNDSGSQSNSSAGNGNAELQGLKQQKVLGSPAIMNQMLACDSSLVVHCLIRGDVLNADHIIQMMSTEESRPNLEGELNFTRAINDLKKKLISISQESPVKKVSVDSMGKSKSLQSIQMVANQGVHSTALTNHVERFLSAYTLPSIQSHSKVSAGSVLQCIENTTAMVTIDLALTTASTFQDFKDLLNIASKYCPELNTRIQSPISAQATSTKPLGYIVFTQNLIALLQEVNRSQGSESSGEITLNRYLRSPQYPFSLKSLKESNNFWKNLKLIFSDFEKTLQESKALVNCKEGLLAKCLKNIKDSQTVFENATKLSESCSEFMDLGKPDVLNNESPKSINYCDLLSRYLSDLSSFILENIASKGDITEPITLHNLLEQSAVDIVDKLIFDYNIEPGALEKKAQQLGFNLSASLIAGCCPRLPQIVIPTESSKCPPSDRIVLNELFSEYKSLSPSNPIEVVRSILFELLIALQTYSRNKQKDESETGFGKNLLTGSDLSELRNDMKIQSILEKTLVINFVRVEDLNVKDIQFFFTCLLNLMMCHCYLSSKLEKTDGVYSKHAFFRNIGYTFLGYNVGELGFVSIADLKQKVVGDIFNPGFTPRAQGSWNWLNVNPDPKLLFVSIDFTSASPPLLLVEYENYKTQVEEAIVNYVMTSVTLENGQVVINDFLDSYLNNVLVHQNLNSTTLKEKERDSRNQVVMKFLLEYSRNDLRVQLSNLKESVLSIRVRSSRHEDIMLKLDYNVTYPKVQPEEEYVEKWLTRTLNDSILRYFSQSSRILADIVQKIHEAKEPIQTEVARDVLTEEKLKYLDLLFSAPWLQHASPLFHGNTVIAALSKYPEERNLVKFFEGCVAEKNWNKCIEVIFALPDYFVFSDLNIKRFKDVVLREATLRATSEDQPNSWYFSEHICDINIRIETVMSCSPRWPGPVCCSQLSSILRDNPLLPTQQRDEIKCLIKKVKVYNLILQVSTDLDAKTWFDVCTIASTSPQTVIKCLVKNNQLELCLQWISLPGILDSIQKFINADFILPFFEHLPQEVDLINKLLNFLPPDKVLEIYSEVIFQLTSISSVSYLVQKVLALEPCSRYRLVEISLKFLHQLDTEEQNSVVHLISSPILIIEQLLMNMKLDALEKVLKIARQVNDEELINQEEVNELIVSYAKKAVEFDLVKTVKNSEVKQSFSLKIPSQVSLEHVVPPEVPDKSQWVPDNMVSLCMSCKLVTFSMFNRRHHCRRCGRVVCGACSTHRTKVGGYKGVAVRVCQNCYIHQTQTDGDVKCSQSVDTFDSSNFTFQDSHYWKLSTDDSRNATIRDEFGYEYSPNVTLCLSLFNLLPDPSRLGILLEQSEKMLKILQLNGKLENPEVDCGVLIQIIRSLILGAKVKYGQAGLISGLDCCDELLSQVDILDLLINNYCTMLIPSEPLSGTILRCLRDKLVEEELWELAMEVSTKCGLDRNGVWASWGKVCLAAGSWEEARIKFSHCLTSSPKPLRNPPLVDEICRILESSASYINMKTAQRLPEKGGVVAQEIAQILSTLKPLSQGKALPLSAVSAKTSVQYEEQVFYLTTYGSHQALLSFYLKQDDLKTALSYLVQQQLEPELFLDSLLLPCYRSDLHDKFKSVLLTIDPSLESFKKYLSHSCVYLQKVGYLHTLYDLQILMQDHVRSAGTCIRLYQQNAVSFTNLVTRSNHLLTALKHLEEELTAQSKKTKRLDCIMKMDATTINRHTNTISRQLEAAKFLGACESQDKFTAKDLFPAEVVNENEVPTLFDGNQQRSILAKMIILMGKSISEGFGLAFRIIQDHHLDLKAICQGVGKKLAEEVKIVDIRALIDCLKTCGIADIHSIVDEMLSTSIPLLVQNEAPSSELEPLCKLIRNINMRISAFIDMRQLISAYILAAKHNRLSDVQRIMEIADREGLPIIKKICMTRLNPSRDVGSSDKSPSGLPNLENE